MASPRAGGVVIIRLFHLVVNGKKFVPELALAEWASLHARPAGNIHKLLLLHVVRRPVGQLIGRLESGRSGGEDGSDKLQT